MVLRRYTFTMISFGAETLRYEITIVFFFLAL